MIILKSTKKLIRAKRAARKVKSILEKNIDKKNFLEYTNKSHHKVAE